LGVALLDTLEQVEQGSLFEVGLLPIGVGFVSALVAGTLVCRWMVSIVRRGNLHYFAFYCGAIGLIALIIGFV
jgi:undecaprenyl-diphosphatase